MLSKKHLSFTSLRKVLSEHLHGIRDHRQTNKIRYSIHDTLMSGFACMYFQEPSLLQFQLCMEKKMHQNNLRTMFGVASIPEATQIREVIDNVESEEMSPIFKEYFHRLQRGKHLEQYQIFPGLYILSLDGTQYFSSNSINCKGCLRTKTKKEKEEDGYICDENEEDIEVSFSHKVLQVALMHPDIRQVIPLMPEEIRNEDGNNKQDCEINAGKRLIPKIREEHPHLGIIVNGDDLFSRQPMIESVLAANMHYIFVAKPKSHKYLYEWLEAYPKLHEKKFVDRDGVQHIYEWMNNVPIHGGEEAIKVNYFGYKKVKTGKNGDKEIVYKNGWVTDLEIIEDKIERLVSAARCRWKIENECFNTFKNQGYCIEHNYGHGDKNLCFNFYLLTLMAFTFHQIFELTDKLYQACRIKFGSKKNLWANLRAYINILIFDTWEWLLNFALNPEHYVPEKPVQELKL